MLKMTTICTPAWIMRRMQIVALALLAGLLIVLLLQTFRQAYRAGGYDFTSYLLSAKALWNGNNPYKTDTQFGYLYPLFLAFAILPLAAAPYWLANFLWFSLSIASLFLGCLVILRLADRDGHATAGWRLAIPALVLFGVLFRPFRTTCSTVRSI
jgi:hypothetical protein